MNKNIKYHADPKSYVTPDYIPLIYQVKEIGTSKKQVSRWRWRITVNGKITHASTESFNTLRNAEDNLYLITSIPFSPRWLFLMAQRKNKKRKAGKSNMPTMVEPIVMRTIK